MSRVQLEVRSPHKNKPRHRSQVKLAVPLVPPTTMVLIFPERLSGKEISHLTCRNTAGRVWYLRICQQLPSRHQNSVSYFNFTKIAIGVLS